MTIVFLTFSHLIMLPFLFPLFYIIFSDSHMILRKVRSQVEITFNLSNIFPDPLSHVADATTYIPVI